MQVDYEYTKEEDISAVNQILEPEGTAIANLTRMYHTGYWFGWILDRPVIRSVY
jgi:hypothetical protein